MTFESFIFLILTKRFVFKNNGVLFENDLLQIGVKSEYRQNLGRLGLFYGNKTQVALEVSNQSCVLIQSLLCMLNQFKSINSIALQNFNPVLSWSPENALRLNVQVKPVEPTLEAGAQIQQMITAECIDDFAGIFYSFLRNSAIEINHNRFPSHQIPHRLIYHSSITVYNKN